MIDKSMKIKSLVRLRTLCTGCVHRMDDKNLKKKIKKKIKKLKLKKTLRIPNFKRFP